MCGFPGIPVDELKDHRVGNVQFRELVQGRGRQKHLAPKVDAPPFRAAHHHRGITAIVLVEASHGHANGRGAAEEGWIAHHVVVVVRLRGLVLLTSRPEHLQLTIMATL